MMVGLLHAFIGQGEMHSCNEILTETKSIRVSCFCQIVVFQGRIYMFWCDIAVWRWFCHFVPFFWKPGLVVYFTEATKALASMLRGPCLDAFEMLQLGALALSNMKHTGLKSNIIFFKTVHEIHPCLDGLFVVYLLRMSCLDCRIKLYFLALYSMQSKRRWEPEHWHT